MEREITLDTETTGLNPSEGHRIIEIGAIELINKTPTGKVFHYYLNPERDVPAEAQRIHGISTEFLQDKPLFHTVVDEFIEFIGDSKIVIHNVQFDRKFIEHELKSIDKKLFKPEQYFCTLDFSRKKFPGQANNLDALCKRLNVDNSKRDFHGALLDATLLADVYVELMGGKQVAIDLTSQKKVVQKTEGKVIKAEKKFIEPREFNLSDEEVNAHTEFLKKIKNPLWNQNQ
jgi:DNA polymerase-3 subunit epsilon